MEDQISGGGECNIVHVYVSSSELLYTFCCVLFLSVIITSLLKRLRMPRWRSYLLSWLTASIRYYMIHFPLQKFGPSFSGPHFQRIRFKYDRPSCLFYNKPVYVVSRCQTKRFPLTEILSHETETVVSNIGFRAPVFPFIFTRHTYVAGRSAKFVNFAILFVCSRLTCVVVLFFPFNSI